MQNSIPGRFQPFDVLEEGFSFTDEIEDIAGF
jgi:hypothetical protein